MPEFTERQAAGWKDGIADLKKHYDGIPEEPHSWSLSWGDEVRPGRGHYVNAQFNDGEFYAQLTMDVYGFPRVSIAQLDWIHSSGYEECECKFCVKEREEESA